MIFITTNRRSSASRWCTAVANRNLLFSIVSDVAKQVAIVLYTMELSLNLISLRNIDGKRIEPVFIICDSTTNSRSYIPDSLAKKIIQ